tara:strand:+ start:4331 stop:7057 length:2727 start_codon:yes stop_codon:yes gene_type:complete
MLDVSSNISTFIEEQYPSLYREEGALLVEFTKMYYEFNDIKMDRDLFKLRDIDSTLANFLIFYKKKFLHELPLDTIVDTKFIVKHIQDLYKRKGSEESLRLLFQLFYDTEIEIFYPSTNVLRPSDSVWGGAIYLEMQSIHTVIDYPIKRGDKLGGDISGASGFVDEIVFVNFTGSLVPIVYLSNVSGTFASDDGILVTRGVDPTVNYGKLVQGSVSSVTVTNAPRQPGQVVGDIVKLKSARTGVTGTAQVQSVSALSTGLIEFDIEDTGYGYILPADTGPQTEINISNQVIVLQQSLTPTINVGDPIYAENNSSVVTPINGVAFDSSPANITGGGRVVGYDHPLVYINTIDRTKEVFLQYVKDQLALLSGFNTSADPAINAVFNREDIATGYRLGDITNTGYVAASLNHITALDVARFETFRTGTGTITSGQTAWINTKLLPALYAEGLGYDFTVLPTNGQADFIIGSTAVNGVSVGLFNSSASFVVDTISATDRETVSIITDIIGDFTDTPLQVTVNATAMSNPRTYQIETLGTTTQAQWNTAAGTSSVTYAVADEFVAINAAAGGNGTVIDVTDTNYFMSGPTSETLNTKFKDAFTPLTVTIGSIDDIVVTSAGNAYQNDVLTEASYSDIAKFDKRNPIVTFASVDFLLEVGEIVTSAITVEDPTYVIADGIPYTVRAKFLKRSGNDFYFKLLSFHNFDTSSTVNIRGVQYAISNVRKDMTSKAMGSNAVISGIASYQTGQIDTVSILNTGFRYEDRELVDLIDTDGISVAKADLRTLGPGLSEGKWKTTSSFLSEINRKIHDNHYYQEYSYDIGSIVDPVKYTPLIDNVVGVAGTKLFSSPLINTDSNLSSTLDVEFQVWDITETQLSNEEGTQNLNTEDNQGLVSTVITLDTVTSGNVTTQIGT